MSPSHFGGITGHFGGIPDVGFKCPWLGSWKVGKYASFSGFFLHPALSDPTGSHSIRVPPCTSGTQSLRESTDKPGYSLQALGSLWTQGTPEGTGRLYYSQWSSLPSKFPVLDSSPCGPCYSKLSLQAVCTLFNRHYSAVWASQLLSSESQEGSSPCLLGQATLEENTC